MKHRIIVGVRLYGEKLMSEWPTVEEAKGFIKQVNEEFDDALIDWSGFKMYKIEDITK